MTTQKIINQKYNLTNQPFGKLTAIELFHKPTTFGGGHGRYWKCKCSCGGEKVVSYHSLVGGMTKSCGCEWQRTLGYRGNHPISEHYLFTGCGEMPGTYYSGVKRTSRERKIDFSVSKEYLWDLFVKQNRKCALSGWDLQFSRQPLRRVSRRPSPCPFVRSAISHGDACTGPVFAAGARQTWTWPSRSEEHTSELQS